ncbi:MAG: enoyl-CoA hydratase [Alphaproteobacteria bacterium 64-6]|nr:MAG: enoyl-CoA hydratase [Hyphomicrobium sp. SCN 65-11]OJU33294.1 MAG: enoyl-CoA hydratase [Alphaproteobacteria bacterium 64-6]
MSEARHDAVAVLTLTRPEARNSLSLDMLAALQSAIDRLSGERGVSAVVLAATGPAFCAGHDLKELTAHRSDADGGRGFYALTMMRCAAVMTSIMRSPKPFIAAVEGVATAAGCQLVATCDLAVAGAAARFATPGVDIGLFCSTPMVALTRNVPRKRAMEMLLLGEMIGAREAADYGLVNRVVAEGGALDGALALGRTIASKSPATIRIGKEAYYAQIEKPVAEAYAYASDVMVRNMMHRDAEEGIGAFIEKRPPAWKGD